MTLDLETLYHPGERVLYDIKQHLYQELVLREKEFRDFLKTHDWQQYSGKNVAITCTADAIVPSWAYMLLAAYLAPYANMVVFGTLEDLEDALFRDALAKISLEDYRNAKVVIKGCSKYPVPVSAYVEITRRLQPVVASLMYGEPCSNVPIYKRKK
ncbi:MAG: DUF2480 family protein [Cytophagales bacterium]|nr:DUF2480 family protein [Cytophagales bacterium]